MKEITYVEYVNELMKKYSSLKSSYFNLGYGKPNIHVIKDCISRKELEKMADLFNESVHSNNVRVKESMLIIL